MTEVSDKRQREIILKYAGLGEDEVERIIKGRDSELIFQLVNALTRKIESEGIEGPDIDDARSIISEYFPLMSFQPVRFVDFLEESLAQEI